MKNLKWTFLLWFDRDKTSPLHVHSYMPLYIPYQKRIK